MTLKALLWSRIWASGSNKSKIFFSWKMFPVMFCTQYQNTENIFFFICFPALLKSSTVQNAQYRQYFYQKCTGMGKTVLFSSFPDSLFLWQVQGDWKICQTPLLHIPQFWANLKLISSFIIPGSIDSWIRQCSRVFSVRGEPNKGLESCT